MVSHTDIRITTAWGRPSYHDVTQNLRVAIADSGVSDGICVVSTPHTTCSIFFDEYMHDRDYYGDEYLQVDLDNVLDRIVPRQTYEGQYLSPGPEHIAYGMAKTDPDYPAKEWTMLNTDGHLRSTLLGSSMTVIVRGKEPLIGKVGSVYFVDFDQTRERNRTVSILVMGE